MFRKVFVSLFLILLSGLTVSTAPNNGRSSENKGHSSEKVVLLRRCQAEYRYVTDLGAPVQGILQDCLVELGDKVKAGQVLGRLSGAADRPMGTRP